jgi:bifunctional oligoribonuclease and PAP phosphatase NrnA
MEIDSIIQLLNKYTSFILTTHVNPDGDGLGSQIALREYLKAEGKDVRCINHSPTPRHNKFLDPDNSMIEVFNSNKHENTIGKAECIIIVDTNVPTRLGDMDSVVRGAKGVKIVIDHHLDKDNFADFYLVDEEAAATGEIVYRLLSKAMNSKLTDTIAVALYTAIMTDTGSFRFPQTNRSTHIMIADLLKYNVDPARIYREVYEKGDVNRMILLGKTLSTLQLYHSGRVAVMKVSNKMFKDTETDVVETDGFVNYAMQIDTVEIGLLFTELDNKIKISFRSRGATRVNELAKEFQGNGHQHAAGATVWRGDLEDIMNRVVASAPKYLP